MAAEKPETILQFSVLNDPTYLKFYAMRKEIPTATYVFDDGLSDGAKIYVLRCRFKLETEIRRPQKQYGCHKTGSSYISVVR